eukprot:CAMPEP_0197575638 /NCGR_PEP_ID=MMETSP1326-20131121/972_1 /TAXON_ID=1155430 /ORGANISM="Genus nov. species nov., Strain RCC2288" /LENGTH=240 /DNA_ID=CAMNT_0043138447 /DNA_START=56 /DNA_END=778 /DNA_ORIENTATION=+
MAAFMAAFSATSATVVAQKRVTLSARSSGFSGAPVRMAAAVPCKATGRGALSVSAQGLVEGERLRLHNLTPLVGSKKRKSRIGRGYGAGQGGSCGKGMRGQNSRSGGGTRPGFEGGQTPMWRRFPKLKGIAGGMGAGLPKFVTINVDVIADALATSTLSADSEVTLEALKSAGIIKAQGFYRNLPLKVLGNGELPAGVKITAMAFSASAQAKIEASGGTCELLPPKVKWMRAPKEKKVKA